MVHFPVDGAAYDPLEMMQIIRYHLYISATKYEVQLLEQLKFIDKLRGFVSDYRELLDLASTPLPYSLVQMGRAFLSIWTFTMPLVLR